MIPLWARKKMRWRPGETVPVSGQYRVTTRGEWAGDFGEVTCTKGEPFPPTQRKGLVYRLVDATK